MSDPVTWPGSLHAVDQIFKFFEIRYKEISRKEHYDTTFGGRVEKTVFLCFTVSPDDESYLFIDFRSSKDQATGGWRFEHCSTLQLVQEQDVKGNTLKRVIITNRHGQGTLTQVRRGRHHFDYLYLIE